jgi:hypothetical protein
MRFQVAHGDPVRAGPPPVPIRIADNELMRWEPALSNRTFVAAIEPTRITEIEKPEQLNSSLSVGKAPHSDVTFVSIAVVTIVSIVVAVRPFSLGRGP